MFTTIFIFILLSLAVYGIINGFLKASNKLRLKILKWAGIVVGVSIISYCILASLVIFF